MIYETKECIAPSTAMIRFLLSLVRLQCVGRMYPALRRLSNNT